MCCRFLLGNENWKWRMKKGRKGLSNGFSKSFSSIWGAKLWRCSAQHSAACLNWVLLFRRQSCWISTMLKSCGFQLKPPMQQCVSWFGWSCSELRFSSEVGQTTVASGKWYMSRKLWNPLFQVEHTHAWSDSCGNWTLQVVRIFQSLAGRTCLNPLNFSKQDAGGRVRSWQGNSGSSLAPQARLAERGGCAKPLCSGIYKLALGNARLTCCLS